MKTPAFLALRIVAMGFDAGSAINSLAEWFYNTSLVRGIVSNAMLTALLLTAMVLVVILYFFHGKIKGEKKRIARMSVIILVLITGVVFIHHYAMVRTIGNEMKQKGIHDVFTGVSQSQQLNPSATPPLLATKTGAAQDDDETDEEPQVSEKTAKSHGRSPKGTPDWLGGVPKGRPIGFAPLRPSPLPQTFGREDNVKIDIEDIDLGELS